VCDANLIIWLIWILFCTDYFSCCRPTLHSSLMLSVCSLCGLLIFIHITKKSHIIHSFLPSFLPSVCPSFPPFLPLLLPLSVPPFLYFPLFSNNNNNNNSNNTFVERHSAVPFLSFLACLLFIHSLLPFFLSFQCKRRIHLYKSLLFHLCFIFTARCTSA